MENKSTAERVLMQLKSRGPQSAQDIAETFDISIMGAHKALGALCCSGLVDHEDVPEGRGRPRRVFSLTEAGHNRFPNRHAELNAELIDLIRTSFGQEGLDKLVSGREARQRERYVLDETRPLTEKLEALAGIRAAEGYMARVEPLDDGSFVLIEDHCPICAAASACQNFCRSELDIFQDLLGADADVTREEHLMGGGRRCTYRVTPKQD